MISNKTVVYTSGTFDLLHINHLNMINYAKGLGDILIVGVNSDELVLSYKTEPMIPFDSRIALMKAIKGPDVVIPQHSLNHSDKVEKLKFDIFVVGDDWVGKFDYLEELGVSVIYFPYGKGVSSTNLKQKIKDTYSELKNKSDSHFPGF
jgi:glycerol-3-phosphate cytidylyltransferase